MKSKTINAIITKKMNDWLSNINDDRLKTKLKSDIIVTGGCITSMLLNEKVNDFDIYIKSKDTLKMLCEYYCKVFNEQNKDKTNAIGRPLKAWVLDGEDVDAWKRGQKRLSDFAYDYKDIPYENVKLWAESEKKIAENEEELNRHKNYIMLSGMLLNTPIDRVKVMINSDGIAQDDSMSDDVEYDINEYLDALSDGDEISSEVIDDDKGKYRPIFLSTNAITLSDKVQIIVRFYGEPDKIHENYDFVHATNYWTFDSKLVLNQRALEAIMNKELFYVGSKYPIASLIRTRKFIKRGWQINAGQYVKMAFQISKLNLEDIYVLEEQLVGVDSIYFLNFISNLKAKQVSDKDFVVTQDYVTSVIDKIFG